jgi:hypothetical protein
MDATAGRRQRDAAREGRGYRRNWYEQPPLSPSGTADAAMLASMAVATLGSAALGDVAADAAMMGRAVGAVALAGRWVAGRFVAAGPEVGDAV